MGVRRSCLHLKYCNICVKKNSLLKALGARRRKYKYCVIMTHKSAAAEGGEVARNQAPPHRLDWPINAMFILGIRKSKIKQNGYYLFFHFLLLNISHNAGKTLLLTHF